jgi:outer membrane protein assembly factor BamB
MEARDPRGIRLRAAFKGFLGAVPHAWLACSLAACALFAALPALAQERDPEFNREQQAVEAARYLYRIEADAAGAGDRLRELLDRSRNEEIITQARFLLGRIQEASGRREDALDSYRQALAGRGLQAREKLWLYRRLLAMSPSSIETMVLDASARGGPSRVFPSGGSPGSAYALEFRGPPDGQFERPKELALQDHAGDLVRLDFRLTSREEILDATETHALVLAQETGRVRLLDYRSGRVSETAAGPVVDDGCILSGDEGEFVVLGSGMLRHYRRGKPVWEVPLGVEGAQWIPSPDDPRSGIIQGAADPVLSADLRKQTLRPIPGVSDKPLQAHLEGPYLALRFVDRFEIRRGRSFETVKWGLPSQIQEKLVVGGGRAYLVTPRGMVRAFDLETGAQEWQKDLMADQVLLHGGEVFATTFAQTCIALDRRGRTLWTYEFGWNREPILLPSQDWLVLHYGDGKRVKLNRELMKVAGREDGIRFREVEAKEEARDWKGALAGIDRILEAEPGNGEAWSRRSAILRAQGAPRQDQLEALVQTSRSQSTPHWTAAPSLRGLAAGLGANWVWKRQYGPKFYPTLVPHKDYSFYLENDNQTLVLINHESGDLVNSFHFSEELDMKVGLWKGDTILVSSPSRLYLLSPLANPGGVGQHPLRNPVCQAQAVPGGVVFSDWYGGLNLLGLPDRTLRWERQLGRSGLLVGKAKPVDYLDVIDLEGTYFAVQPSSGKVLWSLPLPQGTVTESFSTKDHIYAGYNQGALVCIDRASRKVAWTRDFGEQIFSLSGNRENTLVITTASKKLICLDAVSGKPLSQVRIQSYLFNRPTVTDQGYWLGTTEPALEKRNFNHELLFKYKLPDLPGSPILFDNSIFIGTLDNFILSFPS